MPSGFCSLILTVSLTTYSCTAAADGLTGLCVDNEEVGCMERLLPFDDFSLALCEETCTLNNPVQVRGLRATLYDFDCVSDNPVERNQRVMIMIQNYYGQGDKMIFIDKHEVRDIVRC